MEQGHCLNCGQNLRLMERILETDPVVVPGKGELCPECYRNLPPGQHQMYFDPQ